jgi:hypothetical protein
MADGGGLQKSGRIEGRRRSAAFESAPCFFQSAHRWLEILLKGRPVAGMRLEWTFLTFEDTQQIRVTARLRE